MKQRKQLELGGKAAKMVKAAYSRLVRLLSEGSGKARNESRRLRHVQHQLVVHPAMPRDQGHERRLCGTPAEGAGAAAGAGDIGVPADGNVQICGLQSRGLAYASAARRNTFTSRFVRAPRDR